MGRGRLRGREEGEVEGDEDYSSITTQIPFSYLSIVWSVESMRGRGRGVLFHNARNQGYNLRIDIYKKTHAVSYVCMYENKDEYMYIFSQNICLGLTPYDSTLPF
jgi:hypothetical protein